MSNTCIHVRAKRWAKFLKNYLKERVHGLDFSMVYVGDLQRNVEDYKNFLLSETRKCRSVKRERFHAILWYSREGMGSFLCAGQPFRGSV